MEGKSSTFLQCVYRGTNREEAGGLVVAPFEVAVAYCFVRKVEFSNRLLFGAVGVVQHEYAALKLLFVLLSLSLDFGSH